MDQVEFTEDDLRMARSIAHKKCFVGYEDEAYNDALFSISKNRTRFSGGGLYTLAFWDTLDEARRFFGGNFGRRERENKQGKEIPVGDYLDRSVHITSTDINWLSAERAALGADLEPYHMGDPTLKLVVERLVAGVKKQDIAKELGVTPGQVSHHITKIKHLAEVVAA